MNNLIWKKNMNKEDRSKFYAHAVKLVLEGHHISDVAKDLGMQYGTLKKYLESKDLYLQKPNTRIPFKYHKDITDRYINGESCTSIGESIGYGHNAISRFLRNVVGINIRPHVEDKFYNTNYSINQDAFKDIDTESCAYFTGWLLSDGYICPNNKYISLAIQSGDVEILEKFKEYLNSNNKILSREHDTGSLSNSFTFSDKAIVTRLRSLGLENSKSLNENCPEIFKYNHHFWRGYLDGDGSIYRGKSAVRVEMHGGSSICEDFQNYCKHLGVETSIYSQKCKSGKIIYRCVASGFKKSKIILDELYSDSSLRLSRKYQTYLDRIVYGLY